MRKPIEINSRVAARRGPFEPTALGRVRQQRALKFGNVVESVASNKFRIKWDDGTKSCETTNVLKLQTTGAGALPAPDDLNNITTRPIPRPDVISRYFARSPRVDSHNQGRHHDQMLEKLWLTHYRWFHLHTTVAGIHVTECWKLAKHYLPRHHPLKESTVVNFADVMFKALIYNGLTGEVEPTRRTESVLTDITNEPPPLPHSIMHLGKRQGNDNATKQARCTILSHPERNKDFCDRIAEVTVKRPELFYLAAAGMVAAQFNVRIDDCDRKAIKNAVSRRAAAAKQLAILKANVPPSLMRT
eukprot:jgi/Tetstr1/427925/TSEL_018000.t1